MNAYKMIKQIINVKSYFKVIVYYNVDYDLFDIIEKDLIDAEIPERLMKALWYNMYHGLAKAVTYSNLYQHICIVLFNPHKSKADYIDSIVHEAEHVKQAMLKAYQVEDKGEPPAYTIGYLISQMYQVFQHLICGCEDS
jgi:hypothetical protein